MIQITFFNNKRKEAFFLAKKILKKQKIMKNFFQYYLIEKYTINNFLFFIWYFFNKRCFKVKFSGSKTFSQFYSTKGFNLKSFNTNKNLMVRQTFSKRIWINKAFFSLNFLIFPLEKKVPNNIFLNFVFTKKKPKF